MTRTQIQLPDELYERAKVFAQRREMSLAEVVRRGLDHWLSIYPETATKPLEWQPPKPRHAGWKGLSHADIKTAAQDDEEFGATKGMDTTA